MTEFIPGEDVGEMHLNDRQPDRGDRRVRITSRIEDDPRGPVAGILKLVDQPRIQLRQGGASINLRFSLPQQVQIGSV